MACARHIQVLTPDENAANGWPPPPEIQAGGILLMQCEFAEGQFVLHCLAPVVIENLLPRAALLHLSGASSLEVLPGQSVHVQTTLEEFKGLNTGTDGGVFNYGPSQTPFLPAAVGQHDDSGLEGVCATADLVSLQQSRVEFSLRGGVEHLDCLLLRDTPGPLLPVHLKLIPRVVVRNCLPVPVRIKVSPRIRSAV